MSLSLIFLRLEVEDSAPLIDIFYCAMPKSKRLGSSAALQKSSSDSVACRGRRTFQDIVIETYDEACSPVDVDAGPSTSGSIGNLPEPSTCSKNVIAKRPGGSNEFRDTVPFFSGNPFVEKTNGILHLYKQNDMSSISEDGQRSDMICMLAMPATVTIHDLLRFLSPVSENIQQMRVIRDSSPNIYMVLLHFRNRETTDEFYSAFNGVPFNGIEPDICHLAYVAEVETVKSSEGASLPIEGHTELPTCPVCLERMDESVDGILTILCNHSFHGSCLSQWGDTSCPVCRYCQTPELTPDHRCEVCGKEQDLWICLICGNIGCGRYEQAHAYQHFTDTNHTYSLQVGGQRVWDYAGDNYVHRLIQNKTDGKLVEYEEPLYDPADLQQEEKIDAITLEYTYLLTSQLESQRLYFEDKMNQIEKVTKSEVTDLSEKVGDLSDRCQSMKSQVSKLEAEKQAAEKKVQQATTKLTKINNELKEEKELNRCLLTDQSKWSVQVQQLENKLKDYKDSKEKEIRDLTEQLKDLMFHLEAEVKLQEHQANADPEEQRDIQEGHIVLGDQPSNVNTPKKRNRRR